VVFAARHSGGPAGPSGPALSRLSSSTWRAQFSRRSQRISSARLTGCLELADLGREPTVLLAQLQHLSHAGEVEAIAQDA
jgi:hypothetical protein